MFSVEQMLKAGFNLVPIPYGRKGPTDEGWNLPGRCVADVSQLPRLTGKNVGLAHAYCTPTATCALDIDNYRQAKAWLATHGIDLMDFLFAPEAVVIWSGKRGSLKLLYRLPQGQPPLESKKINGADGRSVLEFRCATKDGKTVQDLLPPSLHPDGHHYQWLGDGSPEVIPEIPAALHSIWLLLIKKEIRVARRNFGPFPWLRLRQESPRQVATIRAALGYISADCAYEIWRNVVWALLSTRWSCAEDLALEWSKSEPTRYEEGAFWTLVSSYLPDRENPITVGTIYHHARAGGWDA